MKRSNIETEARRGLEEGRVGFLELVKENLWKVLGKFYSDSFNRGFETGVRSAQWAYIKEGDIRKERLENAEKELDRTRQEHYGAMTEIRRLSLLVSPEAKEEFDKVVRDRSSFLMQNEKLKIENQKLSIENDDLREKLLNPQPEESQDETERTDV